MHDLGLFLILINGATTKGDTMSENKTLAELLAPYNYQPPEVRNNALVFVQTKKNGAAIQIVDSYRDLVTDEFGVEHEVLVLIPKDN